MIDIYQFFSRFRTPAIVDRQLEWITVKTRKWTLRQWLAVGIILQIFMVVATEGVRWLVPNRTGEKIEPILSAELNFVEYQEIRAEKPAEVQDLSDKIIEKEKLTEEKPINWENAADPALDPNQRYVAKLMVNISPDDYPSRARRANIGKVVVAVSIYISSGGRIRDVKIRNIRSQGDASKPFDEDFKSAVRKILLQKTKLLNSPYKNQEGAQDFVWDTTVTFTIQ